jgi:hypothetical protein
MEGFSGDLEKYKKCRDFLKACGYDVNSAIHVGGNRFEFEEASFNSEKKGCRNIHKILAWVGDNGVGYKVKKIGWICID